MSGNSDDKYKKGGTERFKHAISLKAVTNGPNKKKIIL